ncbi:MAG TPA: PQQ-binding-like beta-propeller repeat protein, partial [Planctomycetota bacterium]|nr:PQQ-binding-like beta-propeller repeat protein [Planctomycetota bacterium]
LATNAKELDDRRTWYNDIEVDPARQRVYVTARRSNELLAFSYDDKLIKKIKPEIGAGAIAVFPDGRVAIGNGWKVQVFDSDLNKIADLETPATEYKGYAEGIRDVECDAAGRLYAITGDQTIAFIRWAADLQSAEVIGGADYLRAIVDFPKTSVVAGHPMLIKTTLRGRPEPKQIDTWQAMIRPADGTDLAWRLLPSTWREGILGVVPPADLRGIYDLLVLLGDGPLPLGDRNRVACVQSTIAIVPEGAERSVAVIPATGRRAYVQGEAIALQVVRRYAEPPQGTTAPAANVMLSLDGPGGTIGFGAMTVDRLQAAEIPASVTRRLAPGSYTVTPQSPDHESYALDIEIASSEADSPVQRINYHEMGDASGANFHQLPDQTERIAFSRDYARAMAELGINRETDRVMGSSQWRRDWTPADLAAPGYAPPEYYAIPNGGGWEIEEYFDLATSFGIRIDSMILGHCSGVRFRDFWLRQLDPKLQQAALWRSRFPSFYGFLYNDEMFFGQWVTDWTDSDKDWLKKTAVSKFKDSKNPMADTYMLALRTMYDSFNGAVMKADPRAHRTATPMWQFPAVEGSYPPVIYKDMTETFSHYISEGYHIPWYAAHSANNLKRPGLPVMGVVDWGVGGDRGGYANNAMQILACGAQGIGYQGGNPWEHGQANDEIRTVHTLAKIYGPVFAEFPPANEGAVLYSYQQDVTERRNGIGTPHFERVWGVFGAGLMTGTPLRIICEEDVSAGWLLSDPASSAIVFAGNPNRSQSSEKPLKPRVPMLFLVGQKEKLPDPVNKAIAAYIASGGKVIVDADSAEYPGASQMPVHTHETAKVHGETYAADSAWPMFQPGIEKLADEFGTAVRQYRRFAMDGDDPWVAKTSFDGGAIRYMMLATETSPFPWDAGTMWSMMSACYNGSWQPKMMTLTFPLDKKAVVYDVFDHRLVSPKVQDGTASMSVDLTTWPGRLFAIAPVELGPPQIYTAVNGDTLTYRIEAADRRGRKLAARVPLRIRLVRGERPAEEVYRGTGADGVLAGTMPLPINAKQWTLEATELISGRGAAAALPEHPAIDLAFVGRPDVEINRPDRVRNMLIEARKYGKAGITLVMANEKMLTAEQIAAVKLALRHYAVIVSAESGAPQEVTPGIYVAVGTMKGGPNSLGPMLLPGYQQNLFAQPLSAQVPGPGRGFVDVLFAPRGYEEDCVALVGGDDDGLAKTLTDFGAWLNKTNIEKFIEPAERPAPRLKQTGKPAAVAHVPSLNEMAGVELSDITIAPDRKHLLVTADGWHKNAALILDEGDKASVLEAERVGQARTVASPYVSRDGKLFGASSRTVADFGEGFHLFSPFSPARLPIFAGFGDMPFQSHEFAANDDASIVVAPGTFGVVCWKREDSGAWKEAWAIDYWKQFNSLDWPVANDAERIPQFNAFIPAGADYVIIVFCEFSQQGWVTPENFCTAYVAALNLADGKQRWRFDVPIPKTQLWPKLHTSPDGRRMVLQVQLGGWGRETFTFYALGADGKAMASWDSKAAPSSIAIADRTGRIAETYRNRLLEMRAADGSLIYNVQWPDEPLSLAFAEDGETLFVADSAGNLACLDGAGERSWEMPMGCSVKLAAAGDRLYAAAREGRLLCLTTGGSVRWLLDLNPVLNDGRGMAAVVESAKYDAAAVVRSVRPCNLSPDVPQGENLLAAGKATLKLGGTGGWMSDGKLLIAPDVLTNGKLDDVDTPWLHLDEVFWDACAGRQVYAEIEFPQPADVKAVTVYENPKFKASWPMQGLIQKWNDEQKRYETVLMGVFMGGPVNTYPVDLKGVTKIRYVPWNNYFRNFYTSEIEVR